MKRLRLYDYPPRDDDDGGVIVINTGLSVQVRGHLVDLVRDDVRRVAIVRVSTVGGYTATGLEQGDVRTAADLLAARAQRFLGHGWTVIPWTPTGMAPASGA
jgi:hypothetical protein